MAMRSFCKTLTNNVSYEEARKRILIKLNNKLLVVDVIFMQLIELKIS